MIEELPIYSQEAERAVLGCMLVHAEECCDSALDVLQPSDFFQEWHQRMFSLLRSMRTAGKPIDAVTAALEIKDAGLDVGPSLTEIANLMESFRNPSSLMGYVGIVKKKATARAMQECGIKMVKAAQNSKSDHSKELAAMATKLESLSTGWDAPIWDGVKPWEEFAVSVSTPDDAESGGYPTGFGYLDSLVRFKGGRVYVFAARAGIGKTRAALNLAVRWWDQGIPGTVVSLEMKLRDLQECIIANVSGVTLDSLEARRLTEEQLESAFGAIARAKKWEWAIYDRPRLTLQDFKTLCRAQAREGSKFIVLDYFQLVETEGSSNDRRYELEKWMREIKRISMELDLVMIVLSQLNRETDKVERPKLSHLKETGAIEQDADVVILLYEADEKKRTLQGHREVTWIIAKQRRGDQRDLIYLFDGPHARFSECAISM